MTFRYARYTAYYLVTAIFLLCLPYLAYGQLKSEDLPNRKGIKAGDILLHGAFKAQEELETNIFLAKDQEKFDSITALSPSMGIEIPLRDHSVSADYEIGFFLYGKYPDQNHIDHKARGLIEINWTDYKITSKDIFRIYTDRAADETSSRIKRYENNWRTGVEAQFDQFGFDAGYTNGIEAYGSDTIFYQSLTYEDKNRMLNMADAAVSYRFMPKTSVFVEGDLGFIHYYDSSIPPDSYFINALIGLKGKPTNKINVNIKGGFKYQHYDKSDVLNDKAFIGPVIMGGVEFIATKKDTVTLQLEKNIYESIYMNMNYYDINMAGLIYKHKFNDKMMLTSFGSYQFTDYPGQTTDDGQTARRYDHFLDGGCSFKYDIRKWLSAEAKYEYRQRISKFSKYDYVDNLITFNGTVGF